MKVITSEYKIDTKKLADKLILLVLEENIKILLTKTKKCGKDKETTKH